MVTPFFVATAVGRLGIAMTGLGLLTAFSRSPAEAGLVVGAFAAAEAVCAPQLGRLVDRYGQRAVLPVLLLAHGAAMAATLARPGPVLAWCASAALAGAALPPLGALSAARWAHELHDARLRTAYAMEAAANDAAFLVGPALVGVLATVGRSTLPVAVATGLVLTGGGALAAQRRSAPPPHEPTRADGGGRLWTPGFAALLGVPGALGMFFGALQLSVTAAAGPRGGFLYGALTLASLVGGIAWTRIARRIHRPPATVLRGLTVYFGLSGGLLAFSPWLVASLCAAGVALAPIMAMSTVRAEGMVPAAVRTRAFAWMGAISAAGVAVGAAAAGTLVGAHGPRAGLVLAGACAAVTALSGGSPGRGSPAASDR